MKYNLNPKLEPEIEKFLNTFNFKEFKNIFEAHHISFPETFDRKIKELKSTIREDDEIYFAMKSTYSPSLIKKIVDNNCGLDVSTINELNLAINFKCEKILAGGPKSEEYLSKAIEHAHLISVDSFYELDEIIEYNKKKDILIRLNDLSVFGRDIKPKLSKFGFRKNEIDSILEKVKNSKLNISGIHFHSDGYKPEERSLFFNDIYIILDKIKKYNHTVSIINLGGSFNEKIIENPYEYEMFIRENMNLVRDRKKSLFLNNNIYSVKFDSNKNTFQGISNLKSLIFKKNICDEMEELYQTKCYSDSSFKDILDETGIKLIIEPGYGLSTNCGLSFFSVQGIKNYDNDNLLILNGHKFNLSINMFEYLPNPIVKTISNTNYKETMECFIAGSLCREDDIFMKRKVFVPKTIKKGDLVFFVNTGSYAMTYENCSPQRFNEAKFFKAIKKNKTWVISNDN